MDLNDNIYSGFSMILGKIEAGRSGSAKFLAMSEKVTPGTEFYVIDKKSYDKFFEEAGTERQNKFFHALIAEVYSLRAWSIPGKSEKEQLMMTLDDFREWVKVEFGQGYEYFMWIEAGKIKKSKNRPKFMSIGFTKSWSKYTKKQRSECITAFLSWLEASGMGYLIGRYAEFL